jgi:hypothetical protein
MPWNELTQQWDDPGAFDDAPEEAPTKTAGVGSTIFDRISDVAGSLINRSIETIAAKTGIVANSRQGTTGRTDIYSGGEPRFTVNIAGVAVPLKETQIQKASAGQPFNLTRGQRDFLAAAGLKIGLAASRGITVSYTGGQAMAMRGNQILQANSGGGGGDEKKDDTTTVLYFLLAAGVLVLFLAKK